MSNDGSFAHALDGDGKYMRRRAFLTWGSLAALSLIAPSRKTSMAAVPPFLSTQFSYGRHFPYGNAVVDYIYGSDGTWKQLHDVQYIWNYYWTQMTRDHPFNRFALIEYANGTHQTTTRDINGHLLLDFNHDGEIDQSGGGSAFQEHSGRSAGNQVRGLPFSNFWFDDNWLARYMAQAYNRPEPFGLSVYNDFTRWKILGGDTSYWFPYGLNYPDTLALDGLYHLASGNVSTALNTWDQLRISTGYAYDNVHQRFAYPNIAQSYQLGLFKILTDKLILNDTVSDDKRNELIQHSVSLRIILLNTLEQQGSQSYGWVSQIGEPHSFINTETIAANVLALGAGGIVSYEAGKPPLHMNNGNFLMQPYHALAAIVGRSRPGYMTYGPYQQQSLGIHMVDFYIRAPYPVNGIAHLDVRDAMSGLILAQRDVNAADLLPGNEWTRISMQFLVWNPFNSLEFRTWWQGKAPMEIAYIQLRS